MMKLVEIGLCQQMMDFMFVDRKWEEAKKEALKCKRSLIFEKICTQQPHLNRYIVSVVSHEDLQRWEFNFCGGRLKSKRGSWLVSSDPTSQSQMKNGIVRKQHSWTNWVNVSSSVRSSVQQAPTSLQFQLQDAEIKSWGGADDGTGTTLSRQRGLGAQEQKLEEELDRRTAFWDETIKACGHYAWNEIMRWQMIIYLQPQNMYLFAWETPCHGFSSKSWHLIVGY